MIICILKVYVKYNINEKNNNIGENLYPIKCVFKLKIFYK